MTKNFNRDLDQTDGEQASQESHSKGRKSETAPDADPEVAREREGKGFKGSKDAYAETGSRGAGYREESQQKKQSKQ